MLRTLLKRVSLQVVPWGRIGDVIEISYSVYKAVRDVREKKGKRRGSR